MNQRVFVTLLTVGVFIAGFVARVWTEPRQSVPQQVREGGLEDLRVACALRNALLPLARVRLHRGEPRRRRFRLSLRERGEHLARDLLPVAGVARTQPLQIALGQVPARDFLRKTHPRSITGGIPESCQSG